MSFFKGKLTITEGAITGTSITMDENLIMGSNKITGLGTDASSITDPTDAANKAYVDQASGGVPFTIATVADPKPCDAVSGVELEVIVKPPSSIITTVS